VKHGTIGNTVSFSVSPRQLRKTLGHRVQHEGPMRVEHAPSDGRWCPRCSTSGRVAPPRKARGTPRDSVNDNRV